MNRKYLYTHLIVAFFLALVLLVPDFVMFQYRMNRFTPPALHHAPPFASQPSPLVNNLDSSTMIKHFVFFFFMAFLLLMYNAFRLFGRDKNRIKKSNPKLWISIPENIVLCFLFLISYALWSNLPFGAVFSGVHILKCLIVAIISYLFVYNLLLIKHRQQIVLENEKLKTQNIQVQHSRRNYHQ